VPICRAAFGALEKLYCRALYSAMERNPIAQIPKAPGRARRWAKEIALAALLTIAAAAFITVALLRSNGSPSSPFETARKPPTR
jgi:hypothetical protein